MYILAAVLAILIFYVLTNTSDKKINKKIKRILGYQEVSYREKLLRGVDEGSVPYSSDLTVKTCFIESEYAHERMRYIVISPKKVEGKRYPCVLFLHGIRDVADDWISKGRIIENYEMALAKGKIKEMVMVIPDSGYDGESWYANFTKNKERKYESYFIKELIPQIKSDYSISEVGVAGFSMGGHGAFKLGLRNLEIFKVMGSFAGAISLIRLSVNRRVMRIIKVLYVPPFVFGSKDKKHFLDVFGSFGYQIIKQDPYSLIKLLHYKSPEKLQDRHFYLSVGDEDKAPYLMLQQWIDIVGRLKKYKVSFTGSLYRGEAHTWEYVSKDLPNLLEYFSRHLD